MEDTGKVCSLVAGTALCLLLAACGSDGGGGGGSPQASLDEQLRALVVAGGLKGSPHLREPDLTGPQREIREVRRELGRLLFFDHVLSGIEQTSCGTCHHAAFQFTDARNIARGVFCDVVPEVSITCHDAPEGGAGGNVVGPLVVGLEKPDACVSG